MAISVFFNIYRHCKFAFFIQVAANQIVDLIHERASLAGSPEVLLLSNSIKNLVLSSSPSQVSTSHVSTPVQIKNMITNASFRAKKLKDDIPKVPVDAIAEDDSVHSSGGKPANLASMTSIGIVKLLSI